MNSLLYLVSLAGSLCEIAGVLLTANKYLPVYYPDVPLTLIMAIVQWKKPSNATILESSSVEDHSSTVRGLGLIFVGFVIQALSTIGFLAMNIIPSGPG
ncbi:MAG: hypothetical protein B7Z80_16610 [Rhodospirillales bacterium 20-64-7]|nr:MAG: hypothetical protein B7Z80_16610 [Rhodospirillales bacterium 20-64-7]